MKIKFLKDKIYNLKVTVVQASSWVSWSLNWKESVQFPYWKISLKLSKEYFITSLQEGSVNVEVKQNFLFAFIWSGGESVWVLSGKKVPRNSIFITKSLRMAFFCAVPHYNIITQESIWGKNLYKMDCIVLPGRHDIVRSYIVCDPNIFFFPTICKIKIY